MTWPDIAQMNGSDLSAPFLFINNALNGLYMNLILFAVWCILCFAQYFIQKRAVGTGDFPACLAVGSFLTLVFAMILRLIPGMISGTAIGILIAVFILTLAFFMFSRD